MWLKITHIFNSRQIRALKKGLQTQLIVGSVQLPAGHRDQRRLLEKLTVPPINSG